MIRNRERREFFRIRDRLPIEFRQISTEEFTKLKDFIRYNSTQVVDKINEFYLLEEGDLKGENSELHAYMQVLNKKLDMIMDFLYRSKQGDIYRTVQTNINVSGAGVQFESDVSLKEADLTELKIIIPLFPYPKITALCEVMRTERIEDDSGNRIRTALKFIAINENDRDLLINYIFVKEREYLRQKKETAS
ncbi:MAG TPA: PilZ domain-containing protein [Syntrophorhabdaceae bacterium]|nr:PilZ domain-containing protein [Syntrophorhabdaceae bacterium]